MYFFHLVSTLLHWPQSNVSNVITKKKNNYWTNYVTLNNTAIFSYWREDWCFSHASRTKVPLCIFHMRITFLDTFFWIIYLPFPSPHRSVSLQTLVILWPVSFSIFIYVLINNSVEFSFSRILEVIHLASYAVLLWRLR